MKKIAVVEDDSHLFELLQYTFEREGYLFVGTQLGRPALDLCRQHRPDLIVLDIMLSDVDGLEICRRIRRDRQLRTVPIIFLTARTEEPYRVLGLELGANDYVLKPFSVRELLVRIKIHLRSPADAGDLLVNGPLELDRNRYQVRLNGEAVPLTATEFRLLEHLMSSPGQVFQRSQLLDAVWGRDRAVLERTVDVFIVRLRNKLESDPVSPKFLQSVRGVGYAFRENTH